MDFVKEWVANEDDLIREGASLGALLARMKDVFHPLLFSRGEYQRLIKLASGLPPTLAGFPLWIGFPIDNSPPGLLLDVSVLSGTRSAQIFEDMDLVSTAGVVPLLRQIGSEQSSLKRIVGNRVLLQYEIPAGQPAKQGLLLYPEQTMLAANGSDEGHQNFGIALHALADAAGQTLNAAEHQQLEHAWLALDAGTRVGVIGVFPQQRLRVTRLVMLGLSSVADVVAFLDRVGWTGKSALVAATLQRLDALGALAGMTFGVQLDLHAEGMAPVIELQVFSAETIYDPTGWFKDKHCWTALLNGLAAGSLLVPDKLAELTRWSMGTRTLIGRSGLLLLLQRIHHFALAFGSDGEIKYVNAHVFMLLNQWSKKSNGSTS
ncbi:MAG: hypothetical protein OXE78_07730 [Gammaproteobacteria bacterium]|nr:hypothetical protein [Gammaproteobacteria bacterium]MCY4358783.1 hypothetical protein [Gammaproteobacteria bacterium]